MWYRWGLNLNDFLSVNTYWRPNLSYSDLIAFAWRHLQIQISFRAFMKKVWKNVSKLDILLLLPSLKGQSAYPNWDQDSGAYFQTYSFLLGCICTCPWLCPDCVPLLGFKEFAILSLFVSYWSHGIIDWMQLFS